jgi:hypothetical protein
MTPRPLEQHRVYMVRLEADDLSGGRTATWLAGNTIATWYWSEVLYREHLKNDRHPEIARRAIPWPDDAGAEEVEQDVADDLPF